MVHDGGVADQLTFQECRVAARAVRQTRDGRRATRIIRPFGIGPYRSRPPLPVLLYLASREERLVWRSAEAFAVIEPPLTRRDDWVAGGKSFRALDLLVRGWSLLILLIPPVIVALVAQLVARSSASGAVIALATAVAIMLYLALYMLVVIVRALVVAVLAVSYRGRRGGGFLGADLESYQWTMTLCHAPGDERLEEVVRAALDRSVLLTTIGLRPDPAFKTVMLACRSACATDPRARSRLERSALTRPVGEGDWLVIGARGRVERPNADAVRPMRIVPLVLTACLVMLVGQAQFVAETERTACPTGPCGSRPVTFTAAFGWVLRHAIWQFPGPVTGRSQAIGATATVLLPLIAVVVLQALSTHRRYLAERKKVMYQSLDEYYSGRRSVLVLVINEIERDAVIAAAARSGGGRDPTADRVGTQAVYRLGPIGSADVVLAQSEQGTVSSGAMTLTAKALLDGLTPDAVILTGVCYGLKSRRYDGGDQELTDLIVSTQLRSQDHRKVTVGPDGERFEITRGARPEPAARLLSHARAAARGWPGAPVHFGPVVSLNTLLDNDEERTRVKRLDEEAVAGEMELAGLYAAAARTKTDWILVKGISDWGVGKSDGQQEAAAANAAGFVIALIEQLAPR
jgi:nucleoside phosphorylase